jgi:hypothetical protein
MFPSLSANKDNMDNSLLSPTTWGLRVATIAIAAWQDVEAELIATRASFKNQKPSQPGP